MPTLLVEIGCEEIPARFLESFMDEWSKALFSQFTQNNLHINKKDMTSFSTFRRLALLVDNIPDSQENYTETLLGPPLSIAKNNKGEWLPPALGFAKKINCDLDKDMIQTTTDSKGRECLSVQKNIIGVRTKTLLSDIIAQSIDAVFLPIAMRWGTHQKPFIRPIHWLVGVFNTTVIPFNYHGITSSNISYGHRFLSQASDNSISGKAIKITDANNYESLLESQYVIPDASKRRSTIVTFLKENNQETLNEALLEEVVNLVEHPYPLVGSFDKKYLSLPECILSHTMMKHQKYFPLYKKNTLTNNFCLVADNVTTSNKNTIIEGNEMVIKARLEDASFFWKEDLRSPFQSLHLRLKNVVFQKGLGSIYDKTKRVAEIGKKINAMWDHPEDNAAIAHASCLIKNDLVTNIVYELPELQGEIGAIYASKSGESEDVCKAIREHYFPLSSSSPPPSTVLGAILSIADKTDTIVASYQNNLIPTGSKDPLGIRRAMLGILSIIHTFKPINIDTLFDGAFSLLSEHANNKDRLNEFFNSRLFGFLKETADVDHDIAEAVLHTARNDLNKAISTAKLFKEIKTNTPEEFKKITTTAVRVKRLAKSQKTQQIGRAHV